MTDEELLALLRETRDAHKDLELARAAEVELVKETKTALKDAKARVERAHASYEEASGRLRGEIGEGVFLCLG